MSDLRPMDTAPRDGTWVLAYPPLDEGVPPFVVQWVTGTDYYSWRTWEYNHVSGWKDGRFIGWLPLPDTETAQEKQK